jgi:hypothetical protein
VSGRKDAFASEDELTRETEAIAGPVEIAWVDGGHDPKRDAEIVAIVADWMKRVR